MTKPHLRACPACARHVRVSESACPFCRSALPDTFGASPSARAPGVRLTRAALFAFGTGAAAISPACSSSTSPAAGGTDAGTDTGQIEPAYGGPPEMYDAAYGGPPIGLDAGGDAVTDSGGGPENDAPLAADDGAPVDSGHD
jgi:hypothetical protein